MKTRVILLMALAALTLCACSASDPAETRENSAIADQGIQASQSVCQTDPETEDLYPDLRKTGPHSEPVSDPDEKDEPSSAHFSPAGEPEETQESPEASFPQATENPAIPTESEQSSDTSSPNQKPEATSGSSEPQPLPEPEPNPESETPPASEPEDTPSPEPEPEPEAPAFDVQVWIDFAVSYGQQIGLEYDAGATDCWDAPITASSQSKYLERDITSRLSRYLESGMTGFSVWAEVRSDGKYNLYIGYR